VLLGFRFIQGIGSAMYTTAANVMLADISTPANRGRVMSFYQGSLLLGAGLGPTVGGFTAEHFGLAAPFFVFALFSLLASLWAYLRLPETHPALSAQAAALVADNPGPWPAEPSRGLRVLLRDVNFLLISMITFGIFFMRTGAQNQILPLLGAERLGLSEGQIGLALTLVTIIQFVTIFAAGRLADRFSRKAVISTGCVIAAASLWMLGQSYTYWFFFFTCIVMGLGIGISGPIPVAYVADIIPSENYSIGMGAYRAISDLGFVMGPILMGWLADMKGFEMALLFNSLFLFLSVLIFHFVAKEPARYSSVRSSDQR
jgi:MFS family permease